MTEALPDDPWMEGGGPAFPATDDATEGIVYRGMSLRDWFAGQVLPSLVARSDDTNQNLAEAAYRIADAMLASRLAKPET